MTRFVEGLLPKQVRSRYALKLLAVSLLITVVIIHRELNRASDEPLATTQIDWGETVTGEEVTFQFNSTADTLVSWVYLDHGNMSVAIASPTQDGDHVLIGEYHPSTRVAAAADATEGTSTVVLGGVSGYVMFETNSPNEFRPYKGESTVTEVESRIEDRQNQFAPLSGAELDDTEMRGYHSVPSDGVNWVVIKEVPRSTALVVTDQIQIGRASCRERVSSPV